MKLPHSIVGVLSVGLMVADAGVVSGQAYPNKPIRIVTANAGGGTDFLSRLVAPGLTSSMGQQVIIDNRPAGVIIGEAVAKAPPDGYTLLIAGSSHWLMPFMYVGDNLPWDPVRDFSPITLATSAPNVLVVHPSLPVKSVKELIVLAKARPGQLNYARAGAGGPSHLSTELFKSMAGVDLVPIPYKSGNPALMDLLGGQVQVMFPSAGAVAPQLKSGRLRALAVTSAQRSALAPELPTMAASGLPNYESTAKYGVFAPAGTPAPLIARLNQEIVRILNRPEIKAKLLSSGLETAADTPEEFAAVIKSEMALWGKVIKDAGIRGE